MIVKYGMYTVDLFVNDIFISNTAVLIKSWEHIARGIFGMMRIGLDKLEMHFLLSGVSTIKELSKYGFDYATRLSRGISIRFTIRKQVSGFATKSFLSDTSWARFLEFNEESIRMNFTPIDIQDPSFFEYQSDTPRQISAAKAEIRSSVRAARTYVQGKRSLMRYASAHPNSLTFRRGNPEYKRTGVVNP